MPTAAVFADTQAEPASVYVWLDWLEKQLPFPVIRVTAGSLTERITNVTPNLKTGRSYYSNMIPAFTLNGDGSKGIVGRSCTTNFKIDPINKEIRRIIGPEAIREWRSRHKLSSKAVLAYWKNRRAAKRFPRDEYDECQADPLVIQWIGISLDEATRMKPSRDPWSAHRWPLVDMRMNRHDCLRWMAEKDFPVPPRSACVYCPFHSDAEWRRLRDNEPEEFAKAVEVEKGIQRAHAAVTTEGKMQGTAYLHDSLVPLDQVDFSTDEDHGQQVMFQNECEGMCGL